MKLSNGKLVFAPTDLGQFYKSPFVSWMERYALENPGIDFCLQEDSTMQLLAQKGNEHEARFLEKLKNDFNRLLKNSQISFCNRA